MYRVRKGLVVKGYVALPRSGEKLPCIINLRGGSGDFGRLDARQLLWQVVSYAADGYVVVTTQYPGVEGGDGKDTFGGEDDIASIKKLRDILKCIPSADTTRIGIKGHSRGGLMAYMLLREVSWVRASVIAGAPTDQVRAGKEREGWREHQIKMFGKLKTELVRRSPILWASELPKKTPLLIMHGSADIRVRADHSIRMSQALFEAKVPHRFVLFEGADHGITEFRTEYHNMTRAWLAQYLTPDCALPDIRPHGE
jgi:dipeptidyl aminopeptidase/acylaminoacyl peptidase